MVLEHLVLRGTFTLGEGGMNLINELRMLAEDLHVSGYNRYSAAMSKAADEIEKLQSYYTAYNEWSDKTEWMQKSAPPSILACTAPTLLKT